MKKVKIDGRIIDSKKTFHRTMKRLFKFDDYYGENLDALWDLLTEREDLDIKLINAKFLQRNLGDYGDLIINFFEDLSEESDSYKVRIY